MDTQSYKERNPLRENKEGIMSFQWHITDECDQRCRHCYIFAEDGKKPLLSMSFDQMKEVVRMCGEVSEQMDMRPLFAITGGDPILHPDFWKLAEHLKEKGYAYVLMGNPFHLDAEVCKRLKETGCIEYQLSIDGMEKTHDWFRKPGSFQKTLETISLIRRSGIQSVVMMTLSSLNYQELPDIMDAVEEAGADAFTFARYVSTSSEKGVGIEPLEYRKVLDTFAKKRKASILRGSFTTFGIKDHLLTLYYYEEGMFKPPKYEHVPGEHMPAGCHCANATLAILPDGTVMACRRTEGSKLGNIFSDDLMEMWTHAKQTYRRYDKFEACSKCKLMPWCRGCPAVAAAETGDFFGRDPQCWRIVE